MTDPYAVIGSWVGELPDPATSERVHRDLWYVRIPGVSRRWIPVEIEVAQRTVKLTSHVIVDPDDRQADVYKLLLRHNHRADGVSFSYEGREGVLCLVARIPREELDERRLDLLLGRIVETTEATFRSILEIGFARRLRGRSGG